MVMTLVEQRYVNETVRPAIEDMVHIRHRLKTYVATWEANQATKDAIPVTAVVLDDAGDTPRADAPELTGAKAKKLYDLSVAMLAVMTPTEEAVLIGLMVRPLAVVLKV